MCTKDPIAAKLEYLRHWWEGQSDAIEARAAFSDEVCALLTMLEAQS
jgi:hypothetical protein